MYWYEAEVRQLENEIRVRGLQCPVVFYGSSSIRLWSTLAEDIGSSDILNLGFGGSTLEACVYFFDRLVTAAKPCSLVVYAGDNDLGDGRSPGQVVAYFRQLAAKVAALKSPSGTAMSFGFVSVKPSPARFGIINRIAETNAAVASEIDKMPGAYYIDVYPAMLGSDGKPRTDLFMPDGLHMNDRGYRLWTETIVRHRDRIFTADFQRLYHKE